MNATPNKGQNRMETVDQNRRATSWTTNGPEPQAERKGERSHKSAIHLPTPRRNNREGDTQATIRPTCHTDQPQPSRTATTPKPAAAGSGQATLMETESPFDEPLRATPPPHGMRGSRRTARSQKGRYSTRTAAPNCASDRDTTDQSTEPSRAT